MKTRAVYIAGAHKAVLAENELPPLGPREVLMKVAASSMCYSTYKAYCLGAEHKRVPDDVAEHPVMTGHEFSGEIAEVGSELTGRYRVGQRIVIQPAMGLPSGYSPGYSYPAYGGDATYTIVPEVAIDKDAILPYDGTYMANGCLAEPLMCIIGAFHASYHTTQYVYEHEMGIKRGGALALLGAAGPMGLAAVEYALNGPYQPTLIIVTDIDQTRLDRARRLLPPERLEGTGRRLVYLNTAGCDDPVDLLRGHTPHGMGFDDIMVFAASRPLLEMADRLKGRDCCLNFFAGPTDKDFSATFNFYDVHYESAHVVGTSGGARSDMLEALQLTAEGKLSPSLMITHVGGLDAVPHTLEHFKETPGGKKLFYPWATMPLVALADLRAKAAQDRRYATLADIVEANDGIWCEEAEAFLLENFS
ncbi:MULTISPECIES: alcohol dehydrogenase catalytic domain-containing protein [unclassified Actinomyces]|uniref:alcohol dehydrogenase catalytic domain-containing protein n=1 Tax=unclassified Actinomyces TaxID=2609248 RepID=UPI0018FF9FF6|nr:MULTISPECIES: alcohol dehydrogenase catalytic domain-containing protein [unclassified Actinomyces]